MENKKQSYIFICEIIDTGEYFAGRQWDIEQLIKQFEENADKDLPFTTIGKIAEPPQGLPMGFAEQLIQWYSKDKPPPKDLVDGGVMAILHFLQNGFIF